MRLRLVLLGVSVTAWTVATVKILTAPMPLAMAFAFGVPLGILQGLPYLLWDRVVARGRELLAIAAFGAAAAVVDWSQPALTPLGSWGAAAYTQVDNLAFLQIASITGLLGPAFLIGATAASIEGVWSRRDRKDAWWCLAVCATVVLAVHLWGAIRLATPLDRASVRVAAVSTDATFGGLPLPDAAEQARINDGLFARTAEAARAGAKLVVWPEGATWVDKEGEPVFVERLRDAARANAVSIVAAYIVPRSLAPLRYENKYVWLSSQGDTMEEYLKHHPVPGEPAIAGTAPLQVLETPAGKVAGAICYDYDFPALGVAHARLGADLVVLPSSDWRGIDPMHTQMAAVRAIEGGFSILRSTRMGLSAGIDAHGRMRGWLSANESAENLLLVSLPAHRVQTVYSVLGDWTVLPFAAVLVYALLRVRCGLRARPVLRAVS
jgi:apolipoprotein N-acyltransferase